MVNFRATFLHNTYIQNASNKNVKASFVKLDTFSQNDREVLSLLKRDWGINNYTHEIHYDFCEASRIDNKNKMNQELSELIERSENSRSWPVIQCFNPFYMGSNILKRFYALTLQLCKFENLEKSELLGLAEVSKNDNFTREINFLQISPQICKNENAPRELKHAGKAIIDSLKDIYSDKDLILYPIPSAIKFYKKQGFKMLKNNIMLWNKAVKL